MSAIVLNQGLRCSSAYALGFSITISFLSRHLTQLGERSIFNNPVTPKEDPSSSLASAPFLRREIRLASPYFLLAGEIRSAPSHPLLLRVILFYHAVTCGGEASSAPPSRVPRGFGGSSCFVSFLLASLTLEVFPPLKPAPLGDAPIAAVVLSLRRRAFPSTPPFPFFHLLCSQ